jgi:hypothetical protein
MLLLQTIPTTLKKLSTGYYGTRYYVVHRPSSIVHGRHDEDIMLRGGSIQQNNTLDRQTDLQLIVSSRWIDIDRVVGVKSVEVVSGRHRYLAGELGRLKYNIANSVGGH